MRIILKKGILRKIIITRLQLLELYHALELLL